MMNFNKQLISSFQFTYIYYIISITPFQMIILFKYS